MEPPETNFVNVDTIDGKSLELKFEPPCRLIFSMWVPSVERGSSLSLSLLVGHNFNLDAIGKRLKLQIKPPCTLIFSMWISLMKRGPKFNWSLFPNIFPMLVPLVRRGSNFSLSHLVNYFFSSMKEDKTFVQALFIHLILYIWFLHHWW